MKKHGIGEALFAISLAGLAGLSFVYANFVPLLDPLPGPKFLTYGLGVIVLAACAGLFFARTMAASALTLGTGAVAWAAAASPPIFHQPLSVGSWYGSSEAVSMLVGVGTFYVLHRPRDGATAASALTGDRAFRVGRILFGAACLVFGMAHFAYADYSLPFVPAWLPARLPLVYLTGAFHIAAGAGLMIGILPRLAATLEATMIILFGLLVWIPSHFTHPAPPWAGSPQNQWTETIVNFLLAAVASLIAASLRRESRSRSGK